LCTAIPLLPLVLYVGINVRAKFRENPPNVSIVCNRGQADSTVIS
jgi:hypothetical protein